MKKRLTDYDNLSRLAPASHLRSVAMAGATDPGYSSLSRYSPSNIAAWAVNVGKYWFSKRHAFVTANDVVSAADNFTLSLAGDWGTGTEEAQQVATRISEFAPDYTVHLGDTYYSGNQQEVSENFLGVKTTAFDPVKWPKGKVKSFALIGNHDMYSNGGAYFTSVLPALGQQASYFCLQNNFWRILGLDTGYNSTGVDLGFLHRPSAKLPQQVVDWIASLRLNEDGRGLILLSHHMPWSSFENAYPAAAKQLAVLIKRPVLWFWGHEHRMAIYDKYMFPAYVDAANEIVMMAHGRCIGHGGMPVSLKTPKQTSGPKCLFTDARKYPNSEGLNVGYNGFLNLSFAGPVLSAEYRDLTGALIYGEMWNPRLLQQV